jgi:hypothetical protein
LKKKEKINEKKRKVGKKMKNCKKEEEEKVKKRERNAPWITVVIHSAFGCEETVISPHLLVICMR